MRISSKLSVAIVPMAFMAAPAFAAEYQFVLPATTEQSVRFDRGKAIVDSAKPTTQIRLVNGAPSSKNSASFVVWFANRSGQPINFGPENISIQAVGQKPIAVTTYEQAMDAERKKQSGDKFWSGLAAFGRNLSASQAGTTYSSGTYSGNASGYVGNNLVTAQTHGIYSATHHDPAATLVAQRNAQALNAQDRAELEAKWGARSAMLGSMLQTSTVDAGQVHGGFVSFPIPSAMRKGKSPIPVTIVIDVAGEKHQITAQVMRLR